MFLLPKEQSEVITEDLKTGSLDDTEALAGAPARDILAGMNRMTWEGALAGASSLATRKENKAGAITRAPERESRTQRRRVQKHPGTMRAAMVISGGPHCQSDLRHLPSLRNSPNIPDNSTDTSHRSDALTTLVNEVITLLAHRADVADITVDNGSGSELSLDDMVAGHGSDRAAVRAFPRAASRHLHCCQPPRLVGYCAGHLEHPSHECRAQRDLAPDERQQQGEGDVHRAIQTPVNAAATAAAVRTAWRICGSIVTPRLEGVAGGYAIGSWQMSGRSLCLGIPVIRSTSKSRSAGTRFHMETAALVRPSCSASFVIEPGEVRSRGIRCSIARVKHG